MTKPWTIGAPSGPRPVPRDVAEPGGNVRSVKRALRLLMACGDDDAALPLVDLSRRAGLHLTTALRLPRTVAGVGEVAPIGAGAHGGAMTAFEASPPPRPPIMSPGERLAGDSAIAAPVLDPSAAAAGGFIGITMPLCRFNAAVEKLCLPLVLREAIALTRALAGNPAPIAALG